MPLCGSDVMVFVELGDDAGSTRLLGFLHQSVDGSGWIFPKSQEEGPVLNV